MVNFTFLLQLRVVNFTRCLWLQLGDVNLTLLLRLWVVNFTLLRRAPGGSPPSPHPTPTTHPHTHTLTHTHIQTHWRVLGSLGGCWRALGWPGEVLPSPRHHPNPPFPQSGFGSLGRACPPSRAGGTRNPRHRQFVAPPLLEQRSAWGLARAKRGVARPTPEHIPARSAGGAPDADLNFPFFPGVQFSSIQFSSGQFKSASAAPPALRAGINFL